MKQLALAFAFLLLPFAAHAEVLINEVAWMGSAANANAEWIELANSGDSNVDLSGWTLTSSSGSPTITLAGSIAGNGYYLLERTSANNIPGVTADQVYTGALSNSGATLTLADSDGDVEDLVDGGADWCSIGGDNSTKETAQRSDDDWITASATPDAANATTGEAPAGCSDTDATSTDSSTNSTAASGAPAPGEPVPAVYVDAGPDRTIVAGADVEFSANVTDKSGAPYPAADVHWSFGDGSTAIGASVLKSYRVPGTYLVEVTATESLGSGEDEVIVTVENAQVHVAAVSDDGITIANDASDPLDLSFWQIRSGTSFFPIPADTLIAAKTSVLFPSDVTSLPLTADVALLYPNAKVAATYAQPIASTTSSQQVQPLTNNASAHVSETVRAPATTNDLAAAGAALPLSPEPASAAVVSVSKQPSFFNRILASRWSYAALGVAAISAAALIAL